MIPQVGDYVLINGLHVAERIDTVTKVGKTQITVTNGDKFVIKTSRKVGTSDNRWARCYYTVITPEKAEALKREWQEKQTRSKLVNQFRNYKWNELELEVLQRLAATLGIQ